MSNIEKAIEAVVGAGAKLQAVEQAVREYHYALDNRVNGNAAGIKLVDAVQQAMGMPWRQGAEKSRREAGQ